ncbi:LamB/YcsF family protein [Saccharibacillus alkalitolerans]|uniref:5-oxoprolinase subunit A n=1 Tax=Saccharibacillus alkalitolerans TaxID=2705290 RepID=A0ABX0FA95_9BACL|nr:5-oxoprolinase subunit PxpA [Saccharibacillus alkalitolerans]NGZ77218.1 LamB/YcsF family protein [Saccharibacillus alkalitolerans]
MGEGEKEYEEPVGENGKDTARKRNARIDLNCDLGESFGAYTLGRDAEILPHVTSANIACGFHAGDPSVMRRTVRLALEAGVSIGAHPGLPDLVGFGRRNMDVSADEVYAMTLYQIGALEAIARAEGGVLRHVKPHGALYNMAARDAALADAIARAAARVDAGLILFGLSGSELIRAGREAGLRTASEVFADRTYLPDGSLTPRSRPGALIGSDDEAIAQVLRMIAEGRVRSADGADVEIAADTVCIHGDGPHAADFARRIRQACEEAGIRVAAMNARQQQAD